MQCAGCDTKQNKTKHFERQISPLACDITQAIRCALFFFNSLVTGGKKKSRGADKFKHNGSKKRKEKRGRLALERNLIRVGRKKQNSQQPGRKTTGQK